MEKLRKIYEKIAPKLYACCTVVVHKFVPDFVYAEIHDKTEAVEYTVSLKEFIFR